MPSGSAQLNMVCPSSLSGACVRQRCIQQLRKERKKEKKHFPPQFKECLSVVSTLFGSMWCGFSALGAWEGNFRKSRMIFRGWTDGWTCEFLMVVFHPFHKEKSSYFLLDNQHLHLKAVWSQYYCGNSLLIKLHCLKDVFWNQKYTYHATPTFVNKGSSGLTLLTLAPLSIVLLLLGTN